MGGVPTAVCVKFLQVPSAVPAIAGFTRRGRGVEGTPFAGQTVVGGLNMVWTTCIFKIGKLWVLAMLPCSYDTGNKVLRFLPFPFFNMRGDA